MKYYTAEGTIQYKGDWITVQCPYGIVNYYKFWVEKFIGKKISTSYHSPHITVLAGKHEKGLSGHPLWKKYDGHRIEFRYDSKIYTDSPYITRGKYFWLQVDCPFLGQLRQELGLKPTLKWATHLTIGYCGY